MAEKDGWDTETGNHSSDEVEVQNLLLIIANEGATNAERSAAKVALAERTLHSFEHLLMVLQREPQQQASEINKWVGAVALARSTLKKFRQEHDSTK